MPLHQGRTARDGVRSSSGSWDRSERRRKQDVPSPPASCPEFRYSGRGKSAIQNHPSLSLSRHPVPPPPAPLSRLVRAQPPQTWTRTCQRGIDRPDDDPSVRAVTDVTPPPGDVCAALARPGWPGGQGTGTAPNVPARHSPHVTLSAKGVTAPAPRPAARRPRRCRPASYGRGSTCRRGMGPGRPARETPWRGRAW